MNHEKTCNCGQPGLINLFGGVINLITTGLYGGSRVVKTIVEGSVWHGECHSHHDPCHHAHHGCCHDGHHGRHVRCYPETYSCGCCCR